MTARILFWALLLFYVPTSFSWTMKEGNLDGTDFDLKSLKGKVTLVFYVSPKQKNLNEEASDAVKKEKFESDYFASVGAIDLKSSWLPNFLITNAIKKKQKKYPRTIYLKDNDKQLHEALDFKPTGNDVFVFDAEGNEVYRHLGKLSKEDIKKLIKTIKEEIQKVKS